MGLYRKPRQGGSESEAKPTGNEWRCFCHHGKMACWCLLVWNWLGWLTSRGTLLLFPSLCFLPVPWSVSTKPQGALRTKKEETKQQQNKTKQRVSFSQGGCMILLLYSYTRNGKSATREECTRERLGEELVSFRSHS